MKLIDNFVEKFHNYSLPKPEKCFVLEEGDILKMTAGTANEIQGIVSYALLDRSQENG